MEIKKKAQFITDFYGGSPSIGEEGILKYWIETRQDKALLSFADQNQKKGETAIDMLSNILSVFHRDKDGNPILGNWMLRRCLVITGLSIFNAMKDRSHPKKDIIPMAVQIIEPVHINIHNGKLVKQPDGVKTYTISKKEGGKTRSFFKAYELIKAGTTFESTMYFDDELMNEEQINMLLSKAGSVGVGAFRERFGKFEWVG